MTKMQRQRLYRQDGYVIAMVPPTAGAYHGRLIVQCDAGHLFTVAADDLVRGEPSECPKCECDTWMRAAA